LFLAGGVIFATLAFVTILNSDLPPFSIILFWIVAGGSITAWNDRDVVSDPKRRKRCLESAMTRNSAEVFEVQATSFAEFEELEDEGVCYAFQVGDNQLAFVSGQDFYASPKFPSLHFSLVYALDEKGRRVCMLKETRGARAFAAMTLPAEAKRHLHLPEPVTIIAGRLEDLETQFRTA
jgi:hypothetical protein